jgi:hypothetical protein
MEIPKTLNKQSAGMIQPKGLTWQQHVELGKAVLAFRAKACGAVLSAYLVNSHAYQHTKRLEKAIEAEARAKGWPAELLWNNVLWVSPRDLAALLDPKDEPAVLLLVDLKIDVTG